MVVIHTWQTRSIEGRDFALNVNDAIKTVANRRSCTDIQHIHCANVALGRIHGYGGLCHQINIHDWSVIKARSYGCSYVARLRVDLFASWLSIAAEMSENDPIYLAMVVVATEIINRDSGVKLDHNALLLMALGTKTFLTRTWECAKQSAATNNNGQLYVTVPDMFNALDDMGICDTSRLKDLDKTPAKPIVRRRKRKNAAPTKTNTSKV
uniref:Origin recognition complex subunit 6 n=1 Tax=Panagrellus redivivus TaxID=6233 RepID=A0A7E4WA81_PANRE